MQESIWDLAIQQQRNRLKNGNVGGTQGLERSLLFVGSKGVGKTTLIGRAVEKQDQTKPTLALEYNYARRLTAQSLERVNSLVHLVCKDLLYHEFWQDVCHVWELGGGVVFNSLLGTPLSPSKLLNLHIILMVDLSKPDELWHTLESTTNSINAHLEKGIANNTLLMNQPKLSFFAALKSPEAIEMNLREQLKSQMESRMKQEYHVGSLEQEQV